MLTVHEKTPSPVKKIKVLVVDDSALIRNLLTEIINREEDMVVVGAAEDPYVARELVRVNNPDVLTLDVEMPRMDGIEFLEKLMRLHPMPVVMVSTLTEKGAEVTMKALELGAVDFVAKPKFNVNHGLAQAASEIVDKIRIASHAKVRRTVAAPRAATPLLSIGGHQGARKLIVIGASTGGTEAIKEVLMPLPPDTPGILIAQHMPAGFTSSFANRLNSLCNIRVKEAQHGEPILPGHAYISPGDWHLKLGRSGTSYLALLDQSEVVNRHRPSVDVLFQSVALLAGPHAIGIMLTGMGKDGAASMLEMKLAGAHNIVQDEASCVVFGMPRQAIVLGAADEVTPLHDIARKLLERLSGGDRARMRA